MLEAGDVGPRRCWGIGAQGRIQDSIKRGALMVNAREARDFLKPRPLCVDHAHFRSKTACSLSSVAFDRAGSRPEIAQKHS